MTFLAWSCRCLKSVVVTVLLVESLLIVKFVIDSQIYDTVDQLAFFLGGLGASGAHNCG